MHGATSGNPEVLVAMVVEAVASEPAERLAERLEAIPGAIYLADAQGLITHANHACADFSGRQPRPRQDRWCVTWKLFDEDGTFVPHDQCPMAIAIREQRKVRGVRAIAERPDGSQVAFVPYPTPLYDGAGQFLGAANILLDTADPDYRGFLKERATSCRRLAESVGDQQTIRTLLAIAKECEGHLRAGAEAAPD